MLKLLFISIILTVNISVVKSQELVSATQHTLDSIKTANKGKVVLINFWATWCKPCVEEFPDIVKINNSFKEKDFKLVMVSLDFSEDLDSKTTNFLKKMKVDFLTYYNGFAKDDDLINYMDKNWNGGIPGTFIFDKEGKLTKTFIGKTSYEEFEKSIEDLL